MSFIKIKDHLLDDILEKIKSNTIGLSIHVYLKGEYGMDDPGIRTAYINRLMNEGFIQMKAYEGLFNPNTIADYSVLTEKGEKFIEEGGYFGVKYRELNRFVNKKYGYIIDDNSIIKHSFEKLKGLESEIKKLKSEMDRSNIGRIEDILEIILKRTFLFGHPIFDSQLIPGPLMISELLEKCQKAITYLEYHQVSNKRNFKDLHPMVAEVSAKQFEDGHYRDAVNNAFVKLVEVVRAKFPPKDGVDLMQEVFSKDKPKIKFSDDPNERQGLMFLYAGAVGGLRNKYGHKTAIIKDKDYAFELLCFASALFRLYEDQSIY